MQALQDVVGNFFSPGDCRRGFRLLLQFPIWSSQVPITTRAWRARTSLGLKYTRRPELDPSHFSLHGWASGGHNLQEEKEKEEEREREKVPELPLHPRRERNVSGGRVGWRRRFVALRERKGDRNGE